MTHHTVAEPSPIIRTRIFGDNWLHWLCSVLFAFGLCATITGCGDKKVKFPGCEKDEDCIDGKYCFQQQCSQCREDSHCESFESCVEGSCQLKENQCRENADCSNGLICRENTCTACEIDSECDPSSVCTEGACVPRGSCVSDDDCNDDEECIDLECRSTTISGEPQPSCTLESIYFGFDEFSIVAAAKSSLEKNLSCLEEVGDRGIFLNGHTDDIGTDEYNIALSEKRGRNTKEYLIRLGVDGSRLRVVPKGESESEATDEQSRAAERRVDFEWQ